MILIYIYITDPTSTTCIIIISCSIFSIENGNKGITMKSSYGVESEVFPNCKP